MFTGFTLRLGDKLAQNSIILTSCSPTVYRMFLGDVEVAQRDLHKQYGPLVRIAPNEVVSSDSDAVPLIYTTQNPLTKTDWYVTLTNITKCTP